MYPPPYSPDFSTSNHFLFSKFKTKRKQNRFATSDSFQEAVIEEFKDIAKTNFFSRIMEKLGDRARNCIERNGDYFEWNNC